MTKKKLYFLKNIKTALVVVRVLTLTTMERVGFFTAQSETFLAYYGESVFAIKIGGSNMINGVNSPMILLLALLFVPLLCATCLLEHLDIEVKSISLHEILLNLRSNFEKEKSSSLYGH